MTTESKLENSQRLSRPPAGFLDDLSDQRYDKTHRIRRSTLSCISVARLCPCGVRELSTPALIGPTTPWAHPLPWHARNFPAQNPKRPQFLYRKFTITTSKYTDSIDCYCTVESLLDFRISMMLCTSITIIVDGVHWSVSRTILAFVLRYLVVFWFCCLFFFFDYVARE